MITDQFWIFVVSGLLLNLTPGNDMLYVIARSSGGSVRAGIVSALGIGAGCFVHMLAAVAGLSALVAQSAIAFEILKYAGAAYLIFLGIKTFSSKTSPLKLESVKSSSYNKLFWQGLITNVLNPKVALFFLAFLPQFVSVHENNVHWQILFLGTWFNISGTVVNILVAVLFGKISGVLTRSPGFLQWQQRVTGFVLIGLGIKVALSKPS